jgi:3-hydroxyacyl-CoA dehydrogenase
MTTTNKHLAIVGTGVIGASWSALYLAKGLDVVATDPAPGAERRLRDFIDKAWPALERLGLSPGASKSRLSFTADLAEALNGVDFVQENGPERLDFKQKLYGQMDALLPPHVIIASSSSGIPMSDIQVGATAHPERTVIGHPFNPPHLVPLVEIVGGKLTSEETIRRADEFYTAMGKDTVRIHKELPGHVANRLQAALAREVYSLVADGVLSAKDVDTALASGPGLRWGFMGNMMINHLAGGQGGIEHFFEQFAGPLQASFKGLGNPELTPEVQKKLIDSVHEEVGARTIAELEAERDELLIGLLQLRGKRSAATAPEKVRSASVETILV